MSKRDARDRASYDAIVRSRTIFGTLNDVLEVSPMDLFLPLVLESGFAAVGAAAGLAVVALLTGFSKMHLSL